MDNDSLENHSTSQSSNKLFALASIAGVFPVFYFVVWFTADSPQFQLVQLTFGIFLSTAVFLWCQIDARERGASVGPGFAIALLLVCPLALIYYFFRSRGFRGGLIAIAWMLLFMLGMIILSFIEFNILSLFSDRPALFKDM